MTYTLDSLIARLQEVFVARGSMDCMLTVGAVESQVTIAVWQRKEPYTIEAPINLKWLKDSVLYIRTSRSPHEGLKNTWQPVVTIQKALEPQKWDRTKPANWDLLQHATNIDDPHNTRGEFAGGTLFGPLELSPDQPIGDKYAASQQFVNDKFASFTPAERIEYTALDPAIEHFIEHGKNTMTPSVSVYVENQLVLTETEALDGNTVVVRFPFPELCTVVVL